MRLLNSCSCSSFPPSKTRGSRWWRWSCCFLTHTAWQWMAAVGEYPGEKAINKWIRKNSSSSRKRFKRSPNLVIPTTCVHWKPSCLYTSLSVVLRKLPAAAYKQFLNYSMFTYPGKFRLSDNEITRDISE